MEIHVLFYNYNHVLNYNYNLYFPHYKKEGVVGETLVSLQRERPREPTVPWILVSH